MWAVKVVVLEIIWTLRGGDGGWKEVGWNLVLREEVNTNLNVNSKINKGSDVVE